MDIQTCDCCNEKTDLDEIDEEMILGANEYRGHHSFEFVCIGYVCPHCGSKVYF